MDAYKTVAPDGGWAWAVVAGAVIINLSGRSLEPSFGLLFGDLLKQLRVETTGAAVILSTMDAIVNFSGLLVGPLIKRWTYRKVTIAGCILTSFGLFVTSFAASVAHIIIAYSILGGLGIGLTIAGSYVGLNLYFDKRKGQAVGLAMAGTAFGYMLTPQIVSFLILRYHFQDSLMIISALTLNSIVGASLFQPVKWHLKKVLDAEPKANVKQTIVQIVEEEKDENVKDNENESLLFEKCKVNFHENKETVESKESNERKYSVPIGSNRKISTTTTGQVPKVKSMADCTQYNISTSNKNNLQTTSARKLSIVSTNLSNVDMIGSALHLALDADPDKDLETNFNKNNKKKKSGFIELLTVYWSSFHKLMGFELLGDLIYLNIVCGIAFILVGDLHFRMIMPFYMSYMEYTKQEVASVLSFMAIADILSRIVTPMILDRFKITRRTTLLVCCIILAIFRSVLAFQNDMKAFIIVAVINGFIRGMSLINVPLVLAEYATKDNFPSVLGLSMVARGIFIVFLGPLGGYIRDYTQSYPICLHAQSLMYLLCALTWSLEYIFRKKTVKMDG